jgi:hypothetical protein
LVGKCCRNSASAIPPIPTAPGYNKGFFFLFFSFWNVSVLYVTCCHGSGVATRLGGACGMVACPPVSVAEGKWTFKLNRFLSETLLQ